MKSPPRCVLLLPLLMLGARGAENVPAPPVEWIDPDTGHRVVRLSVEPESASLYFHQNVFTPEGDKMVIIVPDGLAVIDLRTHQITPVASGLHYRMGSSGGIEVGRKTRQVYYQKDDAIFVTHLDTLVTRKLATLPVDGTMSSLNADETLITGVITPGGIQSHSAMTWPPPGTVVPGPDGKPLTFAEQREYFINKVLEMHRPMTLFTLDLRTGAVKTVLEGNDWLGHVQFSPTDPGLIMFCHEGNWHKVDRIWTVRTDGSGLTKIHTRTMNMEIAGHEFFSADGKTIWYDLQTPRGEDFWLAGYELATGKRTQYHLQRNEWSVHYTVSPDGSLFAGDGGDNEMVAHAPDGKWIYLFRPEGIPDVAGIKAANAESLIKPGVFRSERLVNLGKHDYRLEPNVHFTPDMKWLIFRTNMFGAMHILAVEIAKAR